MRFRPAHQRRHQQFFEISPYGVADRIPLSSLNGRFYLQVQRNQDFARPFALSPFVFRILRKQGGRGTPNPERRSSWNQRDPMSRIQRCQISRDGNHILLREIRNGLLHKSGILTSPRPGLELIQLPKHVARRAAGDRRHGSYSPELLAVTDRAGL